MVIKSDFRRPNILNAMRAFTVKSRRLASKFFWATEPTNSSTAAASHGRAATPSRRASVTHASSPPAATMIGSPTSFTAVQP
jgi:hypothetical protein